MDLRRFSNLGQREVNLKCPRTFGVTLVQVGSTISLVTNKSFDKIGFSALVKTPVGVFDCKVPQDRKTLDVKLYNPSPQFQYSLSFSPVQFKGFDFSLGKRIGPFGANFEFDSATTYTQAICDLINKVGNTEFAFRILYSCIPQKAESVLKMFKEFQFKLHQNNVNGVSLQYFPQKDSFVYSSAYTYKSYSVGFTGSHALTVNERGIKFGAIPTSMSLLSRADFDQLLFSVSAETRILPSLGFIFRLEKDIPSPSFTTKIAAVTHLTLTEDGDFSVAFQTGGSVTHDKFGSVSAKVDTTGSAVFALNPSLGGKIFAKSTIGVKPTRKGFRTSYSFNLTLMNVENNVDRPFFETLVDYVHALIPSLNSSIKNNLPGSPKKPSTA